MSEEQTKELVQDVLSRRYLRKVDQDRKKVIEDIVKKDKKYHEFLIKAP